MEPVSPEEIAIRCQHALPGDTRAFEQLVAQYQRRVYAITYRLMGNRQDAEDLAQEVFLKIYRNIGSLDDPAMLTAWINRVTTNACLDALTKQRRRPQTIPIAPVDPEFDEEPHYADPHSPSPEEESLRREIRRCLERTLTEMEPNARVAIVLRDVEDRPYQEIADILALRLSTVKMRIHRARMAFQQLLDRICPGIAPGWRGESGDNGALS